VRSCRLGSKGKVDYDDSGTRSNDAGHAERAGPIGVKQREGIIPYSNGDSGKNQDLLLDHQSCDGGECSSCTVMEALLLKIKDKLDRVEDILIPIRREVRLVTDSVAKGSLPCNNVKFAKDVTATPPEEQSKMFESSMHALSAHAKNLERQVADLQKENNM
jgi:hypothetical protein